MKRKVRRIITLVTLLLFPVILNYLSPYVPISGAMEGVVTGSLLLFGLLFLSGIFFGRAWCGWVCPVAALSDFCQGINNKNVNVRALRIIRYSIFSVWAVFIIAMFVLAGGIKAIDPLHLTETGVSVDGPLKYIIYYFVLALLLVLTIVIGKRGACHAVCWMSPFLTAGIFFGRLLHIPQLRIRADASKCIGCKTCSAKCPMSIDVNNRLKEGCIQTADCVLCGECVEGCRKNALSYGIMKCNLNRKSDAAKDIGLS